MGELILVRHGETSWSRTGKHTSWTDLPLTAAGEEQARKVAPLLAERRIALALTSTLARARRTAELAGLVPAHSEADLHEWDYGAYEGITSAEIHRDRPEWDLWTDGVAEGRPSTPERPRSRSASAPTACSSGSTWRFATPTSTARAGTSSWSGTPTSCGC